MAQRPVDSNEIRLSRASLLADTTLVGRRFAGRLAAQVDELLRTLGDGLPSGWSLIATGAYGRGAVCPFGDVDVVLVHPPTAPERVIDDIADGLWRPMWDAGVTLRPTVHTRASLLSCAHGDLQMATALLRVRSVLGDPMAAEEIQEDALVLWHGRSNRWLRRLRDATVERWAQAGDVGALLEPDLERSRGGLSDVQALRWAVAVERADVLGVLDAPIDGLWASSEVLLAAQCEVQRATGRPGDVLLLQDQDHVAEVLGHVDADALMLQLASAGRSIDWVADRFWRRIGRLLRPAPGAVAAPVTMVGSVPGTTVVDDEVRVTSDVDAADPALTFRVAAAAAHAGLPIAASALRIMSNAVGEPPTPWSDSTRHAFISLLGAGEWVVPTVEALEQYGLFSRFLPEWDVVRSLPQRNAFHTYTVDRHLLQTVANAADHVRDVARPDLLLVGALLHDIGKGHPGDHTEVGIRLVEEILPRMGFDAEDTAVVRTLVELHLLLPETAMRRDLADPRTTENVLQAVGDLGRLELLRALTEADSRATGPSAWSSWKASLLDQLVAGVEDRLRGVRVTAVPNVADERFRAIVQEVRTDGALHLDRDEAADFTVLRIACPDRTGLFAVIVGVLALHRLDVVGADVFTSGDAIAIDRFRVAPGSALTDWADVEHDLRAAAAGAIDLTDRLDHQVRSDALTRRAATAAAAPRLDVLVTNDASDVTTMVDVRAPDGAAVLFRLSSMLAEHGIDIRSAKVATLGHEVVDVFYVQTMVDGAPAQLPVEAHADLAERLTRALTSS